MAEYPPGRTSPGRKPPGKIRQVLFSHGESKKVKSNNYWDPGFPEMLFIFMFAMVTYSKLIRVYILRKLWIAKYTRLIRGWFWRK